MSDISMDEGRGENLGQGPASATDPLKDEVEAAREKMGDAAHAIQAETAHFAEAAKDKASDAVEQSKETVLNAIGDFAEAIRKAGEELSDKDQTMVARLVTQAADGLETFSRAASEKSPEQMLAAVRDFGRSNPTAFLAGSVLAGLALGRFARSSASHEQSSGNAPPTGQRYFDPPERDTAPDHGSASASSSAWEPAGSDIAPPEFGAEAAPLTELAGAGVLGEDPDELKPQQTGN